MKDEKMTFQVINEKGEKIECEVLFTFDSDETKKSYMVYTDNTLDDEGKTKVYASIYEEDGKELTITPITDEKEWNLVEKLISQTTDEIETEE